MPELRKDPITGRWVIIATDRARRPSDFHAEAPHKSDAKFCPFCSGNESKTPPEIMAYRKDDSAPDTDGWRVRVVPNKFPALGIEGEIGRVGDGLYDKMNGIGAHEVIIETPKHDATLARLSGKEVEDVLWAFRDRILDLKKDSRFRYILIFKNHGERAGASLEHPHCQLIALPIVPKRVREEVDGARQYYGMKERCIYCDIIRQELDSPDRVVEENEDFITLEPYAARFPFETWILPKVHESHFSDCQSHIYRNLAIAIRRMVARLEALLQNPAYNLIIHTAPLVEASNGFYHWHIEMIPKLTSVAGFEWGTGFYINPTPPEAAAGFLRDVEL